MDELVKKVFETIGILSPKLRVLAVFILLGAYFLRDTINQKLKDLKISADFLPWFKPKKIEVVENENSQIKFRSLESHDIFNVIESVRSDCRLKSFENDPNKTKIFHDFINIMLDEVKQHLKFLLVEISILHKNGEEVSRDELKQAIMKKLSIIVDRYTEKTEKHLIDKNIPKTDAEYVVDLFESWRSETRRSINSRIDAIFASSFYYNNFTRTLAVYELISVSVSLIPKDGIRSFESMNGKFKTINY